jgi:predicted O-methyltransferase YrrM
MIRDLSARFNNLKKQNISIEDQEAYFHQVGLDRKSALEKLNPVLNDLFGLSYNEDRGMWSEHLILFSSLSMKHQIKSILEIGTYTGETSAILSRLFINSNITTIDLGSSVLLGNNPYSNAISKLDTDFLTLRNRNLSSSSQIQFVEMNSLELLNSDSKYDLIWLDGAHGFPYVAIDLTNALRLVTKSGFIVCDDVFIESNKNDMYFESTATFTTLKTYEDALGIKFSLIPKRLSKKNSKYLAIIRP